MRRRLAPIVVTAAAVFLGAPALAHAGTVPCTGAISVVSLDVRAAAKVPVVGGPSTATVGPAAARRFEVSLVKPGEDICSLPTSGAVSAKLRSIAALYATNRTQAHQQLLTLLQAIDNGTIHVNVLLRRLQRALSGCSGIDAHISMSGATKVSADLKAAAAPQKAQDNAAAAQATAAAQKDFDSYVGGLSPASAGDYIAIAQAAQALGNSQAADAALANARNAADGALKALTPKDPCKATKAELDCWTQANMLAQMLGIPDSLDLMKKVNCTQLWSFSMRVVVSNPLGHWQLAWSGAIMKVGPGVSLTPSPGQPNGGVGLVLGGTLTCGSGNYHGVTKISPSSFRFTVDGTKIANSFDLTISSPSLEIHSRDRRHLQRQRAGRQRLRRATAHAARHCPRPARPAARDVQAGELGGNDDDHVASHRLTVRSAFRMRSRPTSTPGAAAQ